MNALKMSLKYLILFFACFLLSSCSSLSTNLEYRKDQLKKFDSQVRKIIFYQVQLVSTDEQLKVFGKERDVQKVVRYLDEKRFAEDLVFQLSENIPYLQTAKILNVNEYSKGNEWSDTKLPVFFVYIYPQLSYQRLPPRFDFYRLQIGITAKIIPLGQVISGKGSIALRTAAWDSRCLFSAYNSQYIKNTMWIDNNAQKLKYALYEAKKFCIDKIKADLNKIHP
uniref:Lipoprotein n=1 Tax=Hydrogenovibrio crunogenus (strain DSM 25203 / XCL-2) TaxID=317025 RepID=Q31F05_HYDCU